MRKQKEDKFIVYKNSKLIIDRKRIEVCSRKMHNSIKISKKQIYMKFTSGNYPFFVVSNYVFHGNFSYCSLFKRVVKLNMENRN